MLNLFLLIPIFVIVGLADNPNQIFTTFRDDGNSTVWDGKWTFLQEWKRTSLNTAFDENFVVKFGHDYKNLYVLLDFISQQQFAAHSDYGLICITPDISNKTIISQDDYCFMAPLASSNVLTFRGNGSLGLTNHFVRIANYPDTIGVGGISDVNDRYSDIPHTTYEFKIPIELVGRSDQYRFYAAAYDSRDHLLYAWPESLSNHTFPAIPSSSEWGYVISPDESLPEYPLPVIVLLISVVTVIAFSNFSKFSKYK